MPTQTVEPVIFKTVDYDSLLGFYKSTYNVSQAQIDEYIAAANRYNISDLQAVEELLGGRITFNKTADGAYELLGWDTPMEDVTTSIADSNVTTIKRGNFRQIFNRAKDDITGKLNISRYPKSGSLGQKAGYFLGSAGSAWCAASTGIFLGKTFDSVLYNANPDFWDSHNMSTLNPETWNNITNGYDGPGAGLFNFILGLDPETGNSQMYINEDALAYMALYMNENGFFGEKREDIDVTVGQTHITSAEMIVMSASQFVSTYIPAGSRSDKSASQLIENFFSGTYQTAIQPGDMGVLMMSGGDLGWIGITDFSFDSIVTATVTNGYKISPTIAAKNLISVYTRYQNLFTWNEDNRNWQQIYPISNLYKSGAGPLIGRIVPAVDGVGDQTGATLPDTTNWHDLDSVKQSLQQQYPDVYNNALEWDNVQPDGTNPILRYIPVPMANIMGQLNSQPTSGNQTQSSIMINPQTLPQELLDTLTNALQNPDPKTKPKTDPQTETETEPVTPPNNPTSTGTGATPTPTPVVGSASALWSVYHPTQQQVNDFGAWLWTDNIITQIQQVLQNPMDGIITLHKVFVQPVDASTGTIVVGRLDSQVSSATVTQQYVYVDCGSVNCLEYFGNVFDYSPYTRIALYLPFIGIVSLNTEDVMRSTINVVYGCDVFTGACLAMVKIRRDGNTVNMYQYSGVCSVEYPLTGGIHSGLINGLLGLAGGIAGIATGGIAAGGMAVASGMAGVAHTSNAMSSSFSGNAGAMGIKTPYLIIERPQTKVADNTFYIEGYPTNHGTKLSECSGFVKVKSVRLQGIPATSDELNEIESLLKSGVIV